MKKTVLAISVAVAASATPAFADTTSGARVEVLAGWDRVSLDLNDYDLGTYSKSGVGFGVSAGYDVALSSNISVGLDGEVSDSTTKYEITDGTDKASLSTGRDLYAGARVTTAVNPNLNLYAKAGYTNARITGTVNNISESENGDGVRFGAGAQFALSSRSYALIEYRYSNYEGGFTRNQVFAGIGFRF